MEEGVLVGGCSGASLAGLAQLEASAAGSDRLETHHVLLALLSRRSPAGRALSSRRVTRESVEAAVRQVIAAGDREERHEIDSRRVALCERSRVVPPSLQAERAFLGAIEEAQRLGHKQAHWGHALLGLFRVPEGIAVAALRAAGADLDALRAGVLSEMGRPGGGE